MKITTGVMIALLSFSTMAAAADKGKSAPSTESTRSISAHDSLKRDYPQLQYQTMVPAVIDGLYEITAGQNILYYSPKSSLLLIGEIYTKDGVNLTAEARDKFSLAALKDLPLDKAIKIGSGKNTVIEFTDVDCPFCRKSEDYFQKNTDITRYVFLIPLEQLHPKAKAKSENILCAENPAKIYFDTIAGKFDSEDLKPCSDNKAAALLDIHRESAKKLGIQGTPFFFVNGAVVRGADTNKIEKLIASTEAVKVSR